MKEGEKKNRDEKHGAHFIDRSPAVMVSWSFGLHVLLSTAEPNIC
jgi:hypothetical protein